MDLLAKTVRLRPLEPLTGQHFCQDNFCLRIFVLIFSHFHLFDVHRDEIAVCSEKAYDSLSLADAKSLMSASDQEWQAYVWTTIPTWRSVAPEYTSRELRSLHHARRFSHYSYQSNSRLC